MRAYPIVALLLMIASPARADGGKDIAQALDRIGVEVDDVARTWPGWTSPLGQELARDPLAAAAGAGALADELLADDLPGALGAAWDAVGCPDDRTDDPGEPPDLKARLRDRREVRKVRKLDSRIADWLATLDRLAGQAAALQLQVAPATALADALAGGERPGRLDPQVEELVRTSPVEVRAELARIARDTVGLVDRAGALPTDAGSWPDEPLALWTAHGRIWLGTPGSDTFEAPYWAVLDPGGHDLYRGDGIARPLALIVDLGGDDAHGGAPPAVAGVAVLADLAGDDAYRGGRGSLGGAIHGCGVLWDAAGDDSYRGGDWSLGAALDGVGLLLDVAGDDSYRGAAPTQGVGGPAGQGWLLDAAGDDDYRADEGGSRACAQGCGVGVDAFLAGGTGLLVDGGGNDRYAAGDRAQGYGGRWGVGLALDRGGDDRWLAGRWSQGAARDDGLGLLADRGGNDRYSATRDAQGRSHGEAIGLLDDGGGDDLYEAGGAAQAFATACGLAWLVDHGGEDGYLAAEPERRWGHAEPLGGRASVALLLDRAGRDAYGPGDGHRDGGASSSTRHGLALDLPGGVEPLAGPAVFAELIESPDTGELDGVIDQALAWPEQPAAAGKAVSRLRLAGPAIFPALRRRLDPHDPVAVAGLGRVIDAIATDEESGRLALVDALEAELATPSDDDGVLLIWWARAAGSGRDPVPALTRLDAADAGVRAAAASVLEDLCDAGIADTLAGRLAAEDDATVRAALTRGLGGCPAERAVAPLVAALGDPDLSVRDNAVRALVSRARSGDRNPVLEALRPSVAAGLIPALEVLVHVPDSRSQQALEGLLADPRPATRGRAALALGGLRGSSARKALLGRESVEADPYVRWCLDRALRGPGRGAGALPLE